MTTAVQKRPAKHDLTHGPVAAAFNASVWPMFLTAIGKWSGAIPPWLALAGGALVALCLVVAGRARKPRPLSRASLAYRASVAVTAGTWMWAQLATFTDVGLTADQGYTIAACWLAVAAAVAAAVLGRRLLPLLRLAAPTVTFLAAAVLTLLHLGAVSRWIGPALFTTERFGAGFQPLAWLGYAVLSLLLLTAPHAILGTAFASRERSADEEQEADRRALEADTPQGKARAFQKLICTMANEYTEIRPPDPTLPGRKVANLRVVSVESWKNGAGETYVVDLTGMKRDTTRTRLRSYTDGLTTKMNLPHGCGIEFLPAKNEQGDTLGAGFTAVQVSRVNVLKLTIDYPEVQQRSILNALPLGRTRNDREIGPYLRESSAYLWGQKGSGKTGTIYDIIAGAMQCTDCLVWVIDLNRGNAARPFLKAWHDGRVGRPCIDWVATTIEEVVLMAKIGLAIALERKSYYADLKFELDTNLMPVGNGGPGQAPPEILIVIDEGATVLGIGGGQNLTDEGRAAREALNQIMDLARDAAVNIVFSGLRATSDVADTAFKAGTAVRIGMRVTDDAELAHGFGDWKLSGKQIPYKGSGYIKCGHDDADDEGAGDDIVVFKAYYLAPKRMATIGEQVTPWRPYLDERSLRVGGVTYANRWRRTARFLWDNPPEHVYSYGGRPGDDDGSILEGEVVSETTVPAGAATADPMTNLLAGGLSRPTGGTFDDLMKAAREQKEARKRRDAGGDAQQQATPSAAPKAEPQQPAAYQAPAGPAEPDVPETEEGFKKKFDDLAEHFTVLDDDPEPGRSRATGMTPDEEIANAPVDTRAILERLVKLAGPLTGKQMFKMLQAGGDWGPATDISEQAMYRLLKEPKGKGGGPSVWLAPRSAGDPYNHRDNVSG